MPGMSAGGPPSVVSTDVLKKFRPWSGTVPAGYFAYFLGNVARADYWAFSKEVRAVYDRERHETFSAPSADDNIFDWLVMLESVVEATDGFTMAALGAGWGRWLVAAALAVKQYSNVPFRLIGVEAEPTHFGWMLEHFRDNGLNPDDHDLIEAAVSSQRGHAWFYYGKPDSWYGQSIIHDSTLAERAAGRSETDYGGEKARRVRTIDLAELVSSYQRIDYLHMDVQGEEFAFLSSAPQLLSRKVKRVLIGTHSEDIERSLRRLFTDLGWRSQYDVPMNGQALVGEAVVTVGDGVQAWINPTL
jgi:FkbM family methyltransferase